MAWEDGLVRDYRNERAIDSLPTVSDPPGHRFGTWTGTGTGYFGKLSGDRLEGDADNPTRREKVLVALKADEDFPGQDGGCLEVFLQRPGTTEDRDMIRVLTLTTRYAHVHVPILGGTPSNDLLRSADGRYRLHLQSDGNLVLYDESTGQPTWSVFTGRL